MAPHPAFVVGRPVGTALRRLLAATAAMGALLLVGPAAVDSAQAVVGTGPQPVTETRLPAAGADEGLTLVGKGRHLLTRGHRSIPARLRSLGWTHVGDPDSVAGLVVDAYQGSPRATSKAFELTYAEGRHVLLVHPLAAGESYHNSFAAVSPDGSWLVAGEWGTESRVLVFALPSKAKAGSVQVLPLAGVVSLTHPMRDVQGCDFTSPTRLLCSTNDTTTGLFPVTRQLLSLTLTHGLDGGPVRASVRLVGSVPAQDVCAGPGGEVEGIDVTGGVVRVAVNSVCAPITEVFTYPRDAHWRPAGDIDVRTSWSGAAPPLAALVQRRVPPDPRYAT